MRSHLPGDLFVSYYERCDDCNVNQQRKRDHDPARRPRQYARGAEYDVSHCTKSRNIGKVENNGQRRLGNRYINTVRSENACNSAYYDNPAVRQVQNSHAHQKNGNEKDHYRYCQHDARNIVKHMAHRGQFNDPQQEQIVYPDQNAVYHDHPCVRPILRHKADRQKSYEQKQNERGRAYRVYDKSMFCALLFSLFRVKRGILRRQIRILADDQVFTHLFVFQSARLDRAVKLFHLVKYLSFELIKDLIARSVRQRSFNVVNKSFHSNPRSRVNIYKKFFQFIISLNPPHFKENEKAKVISAFLQANKRNLR